MRTVLRRAAAASAALGTPGGDGRAKARRVGMVAAAALTAALTATAPAHALSWDWGPWYSADGGDKGAVAYFEEHGDRVKVCDIDTDGLRGGVTVMTASGDFVYQFHDLYNDGRCSYLDYNDRARSNLRENRWYHIYVGRATSGLHMYDTRKYTIYNDH